MTVASRFAIVYFGLYILASPIVSSILVLPDGAMPALGTVWPLRDVTLWLAEHAFGPATPLVYRGNSGDTGFHWMQTAWLLAAAGAITAAWWRLDHRRPSRPRLYAWSRFAIRIALAAQMCEYGMAKIIPTQFPAPSLVTLVQPVGSLSHSDLLWTFMGSSAAYQVFTGCVELVAAVLLFRPSTATLGAVVALASMTQVFLLNMTYDVGLKQIAFHLILMAAFLLAPAVQPLVDVLVRHRAAAVPAEPPLFTSPRANRQALVAQAALGVYLVGIFTLAGVRYWHGEGGGGSPRSPLYGVWDVTELTVDGEARPAALHDYDRRWRRAIFDSPSVVVFQRTDDSFARYGVNLNVQNRTLALTKGASRVWTAGFTYQRAAPDSLVLEGDMDGHRIRARLQLVGLDTFRLLNSTFRWMHPPDPFAG